MCKPLVLIVCCIFVPSMYCFPSHSEPRRNESDMKRKVVFPENKGDRDFLYGSMNTKNKREPPRPDPETIPTKAFHSRNKYFPDTMDKNNKTTQHRFDASNVHCEDENATSFCESVQNQLHFSQHVTALLQNTNNYMAYFLQELKKIEIVMRSSADEEIELVESCDTRTHLFWPRAIPTGDYSWRYVVNEQRYPQAIRRKLCRGSCSKCKFDNMLPNGYFSICEQEHTTVPLLTLNNDGNLEWYPFKYASHCLCNTYKIQNVFLNVKKKFKC